MISYALFFIDILIVIDIAIEHCKSNQ